MEILQLNYFCDAAKSENFSKTARKYGVPPSDVSQSIRRLERELSVELFTRQPNRVVLNEKGVEFFYRVSEALRLIDEARLSIVDDSGRGKINLCINANRRTVMETLEKFKSLYPDTEVITTHFADSPAEDFDIIISGDAEHIEGFTERKLVSEKISLAVRRESSLAEVEHIAISELKSESFITMTERSSLYNLTYKICQDNGFKPRVTIQSDDPLYVRKCVELGLGIAFVPEFSWRGQFPESVVLKDVEGYTRDTYAYISSRKYLSRSVKIFFDMLVSEFSCEKDEKFLKSIVKLEKK